MKTGDIIEFKRGKFFSVSGILGNLLMIFDHKWDGWGWHVAFAWEKAYLGWYILEATRQGVMINFYSNEYLSKNTRYWEWYLEYPDQEKLDKFANSVMGKKYDIAIYFFTAIAIIVRHYFNRPIPKLLDHRFSCWELVAEGCADFGWPVVSKYDVIILPDLIRSFKKAGLKPQKIGV